MLQAYHQHLRRVVGLVPSTCQERLRHVRGFLEAIPIQRVPDLARLAPGRVVGHVTAQAPRYQPASLRLVASALRSFLRFATLQGWAAERLSWAVPKIAAGAQNDLPVYLSEEQLQKLLHSWDRRTARGRRDGAIGLCLARLGLRAAEVAALELDDLNWRGATLRLAQSKNGTAACLPLLAEVGQALAAYLRRGRPVSSDRHVFLSLTRPAIPLSSRAISAVVRRALQQCGIVVARRGAHLLRHTLASHLVQHGASLKEVADVLRHRDLNSTAVYAHLDLPQLRVLAQPWPRGGVA